ncbi:rod-binding protein [Desulfoplanes formicivorans]|nr:rod-binding protein [Desulfoplanes formicivorans]
MASVQAQDVASVDEQSKLKKLERLGDNADSEKQLREAAQGFESIFIGKLWERMRATVPKDNYLHSKEEEFYLSMFDRELSRKMAEAGGLGLGKMLYDSLKDKLNQASHEAAPVKPLDTPLPTRSEPMEHSGTSPLLFSSPTNDAGTMRQLEQLIQKIEQEHEADASDAKLVKDV